MSAASDAIAIQEGACNPRGIARSLVSAIDEACEGKGSPGAGSSPAVRLILHQLLYVLYGTEPYLLSKDDAVLREGRFGPAAEWGKDMQAVKEEASK